MTVDSYRFRMTLHLGSQAQARLADYLASQPNATKRQEEARRLMLDGFHRLVEGHDSDVATVLAAADNEAMASMLASFIRHNQTIGAGGHGAPAPQAPSPAAAHQPTQSDGSVQVPADDRQVAQKTPDPLPEQRQQSEHVQPKSQASVPEASNSEQSVESPQQAPSPDEGGGDAENDDEQEQDTFAAVDMMALVRQETGME